MLEGDLGAPLLQATVIDFPPAITGPLLITFLHRLLCSERFLVYIFKNWPIFLFFKLHFLKFRHPKFSLSVATTLLLFLWLSSALSADTLFLSLHTDLPLSWCGMKSTGVVVFCSCCFARHRAPAIPLHPTRAAHACPDKEPLLPDSSGGCSSAPHPRQRADTKSCLGSSFQRKGQAKGSKTDRSFLRASARATL